MKDQLSQTDSDSDSSSESDDVEEATFNPLAKFRMVNVAVASDVPV